MKSKHDPAVPEEPGKAEPQDAYAANAGASDGAPSSEPSASLEAENASLKDRLLRALAEVENVRRRSERDLDEARQYAVSKFAADMLPVADNLERAIASIPAEARTAEGAMKTLIEGVELTKKQMLQSLERHGVRKLDPKGQRFDPHYHEALFEVPDPTTPSGTVAQVVEPGFAIGTRPLRPAKVGVTSGGPPAPPSGRNSG